MAERIPQSATIRVPLQAYLSSDHVSPATGKTIAITISKNGAAYGNPSAGATNATEIASGSYYVDLSTTDAGTAGPLFILGTSSGVDNVVAIYNVVNAHNAGFDGVPNAAGGATGGLAIPVVRGATAQAGNANSITLDSGASATNNIYNGLLVHIVSGTGAGQVRTITGYNGNSKVATVDRVFQTAPTSSSVFELLVADSPTLNASLQVSANVARVTIRSGTAQTGSTSNTIKLDSGASSTNNLYNGDLVTLTGGTGAGQTRTVISYNGTTKVATVDSTWVTTPDNTSTFDLYASTTPSTFSDQGVAQAGGATSITLASTASATNSVYVGSIVTLLSGTGSGQTREITAYNGTTKVATVDSAWSVNPDSTSAYAVIPTASGTQATGTQDVNVVSWASAPVTYTGAPDVRLANGVAHGGPPGNSTATIAAKQMWLQNDDSNTSALLVKNTAGGYSMFLDAGPNTTGLGITGNQVAAVDIEAIGAGLTPAIYLSGAGGYLPGGLKGVIEIDSASSEFMTAAVAIKANFPAFVNGNLAGTINGLTAAGLATLFAVNSTKVYADAVAGSLVKEITNGTGSLTAAMTESYATDGAPMTPVQALHMIWSLLAERNVSSTTLTAKKLDGSTTAMTFTLNSATQPTGQTRST